MTDHVFGEGSYVECDYFSVVSVTPYSAYEERFRPEHTCYCGTDCVQIARVGFHTDTTDQTPGEWPTSLTQTVKAHRCEEHRFDPDKDEH